ncbi:MAG: hypothetical protein WCP29_18350 [Acidobacteriota bacterium]
MKSLFRFRRSRGPVDLAVDMAGVRMGERIIQVGTGDPRVFALASSKVGLTGHACAIVDTAAAKAALEDAAARQGVLVEVTVESETTWPYDPASFDLAFVDANPLQGAGASARQGRLTNVVRVVRPGGRILAIQRVPRGIAARWGFERRTGTPGLAAQELVRFVEQAGCRPVRVLAEREGMIFVEGFRPGAPGEIRFSIPHVI